MMEGRHSSEEEEVMEMGIMGGSSGGGSSSSSSSSRWNPTKEQISMLENLYKQGLRTPTAEEIQQITARLRVYGHIEGKNVFYWFQNHKARQRQKQKQDTIAYFNRFLHHHRPHQPLFPPPPPPPICPNAICAPYCMPQVQSTEIGFYHNHHQQQHPKVLVPIGFRRNNNNNPNEKVVVPIGMIPTTTRTCTDNVPISMVYEGIQMQEQQQQQGISDYNNQETLDLFPLHPTGILEGKATNNNKVVVSSSMASVSADSSTDTPSAIPDHINHDEQYGYGSQNQPFFCFLPSGFGSLESG